MAVVWSITAQRDLVRIFEFNARYREDHVIRIDERLAAAGNLIADHPMIGRPIAGLTVRERSLADIQYVINIGSKPIGTSRSCKSAIPAKTGNDHDP